MLCALHAKREVAGKQGISTRTGLLSIVWSDLEEGLEQGGNVTCFRLIKIRGLAEWEIEGNATKSN